MEFDEKSVVPVLEAKYDSFTQSEKNIADFFLKNKNQADYSIETLSQKLFVSKASSSLPPFGNILTVSSCQPFII